MADTEKQNFRYNGADWREAQAKLASMREQGYDIDMTKVLTAEVDRIRDETVKQTAERLGLVAGERPAPVWRKPFARSEVGQ